MPTTRRLFHVTHESKAGFFGGFRDPEGNHYPSRPGKWKDHYEVDNLPRHNMDIIVWAEHHYNRSVNIGMSENAVLRVHLPHVWPYEIQWGQLRNGQILDGNDVIRATIDEGVIEDDAVMFSLSCKLGWVKEVIVPDGQRSQWKIWTGGLSGKTYDEVALWGHQVHNGQRLQFSKAKTPAGRPLDPVYLLGNLHILKPHSRVTFQWEKD
ncbi:hypothetical protein JOD57_003922 [Geodermatophilus bullaregiensis]|uniref:hypothetical protein n=1 Tax=Geodermatophilus bullaregiensis TaxID=1564160 RepID=UPI00195BAB19|nr:hypothetical protein [Geodermatophilus bullaregiensis]MBM7808085.1 hypothetical protein [Geodermatophilus bullaregiensis]